MTNTEYQFFYLLDQAHYVRFSEIYELLFIWYGGATVNICNSSMTSVDVFTGQSEYKNIQEVDAAIDRYINDLRS